jgi:hypothetical protein
MSLAAGGHRIFYLSIYFILLGVSLAAGGCRIFLFIYFVFFRNELGGRRVPLEVSPPE